MTDTTIDAPAKSYDELDRVDAIAELRARDEVLADTQQALTEVAEERDILRRQLSLAKEQARTFNETLLEALEEQVHAGNLEREYAQEIAEALGLKLPGKFTVTVTIELTLEGVEADDEDDAEAQVRNHLTVDAGVENESEDFNVTEVSVESA